MRTTSDPDYNQTFSDDPHVKLAGNSRKKIHLADRLSELSTRIAHPRISSVRLSICFAISTNICLKGVPIGQFSECRRWRLRLGSSRYHTGRGEKMVKHSVRIPLTEVSRALSTFP
jgi:hypothetical protein